jgi:hypothetical protein
MKRKSFFLISLLLPICLLASLAYSQSAFKGCPAQATAKSATNKAQNVLKNRGTAPTDIDESVSLRDLLLKANDQKFDNDTAVTVTGFVVSVSPGGKTETCNCAGKSGQDMHIDVVQRQSDAGNKTKHFVVEITPRWQGRLGKIKAVRKQIRSKCVEFTGFLFYDSIHADEAENTAPGRKGKWRKTAWEVHPVTSYEVVADSN